MKRIALLSIVTTLVISCAAPSGAVFASEEGGEEKEVLEINTIELTLPLMEEKSEGMLSSEIENTSDEGGIEENTPQQLKPTEVEALEEAHIPDPPIVVPPPVTLPASPLLITAYKASGAHVHAVQLYNNSSSMVPLDGVSLFYVAGGAEYEIPLINGWVEARSYVVIAWQGESEYADIEFQFSSVGLGDLESVELLHDGYQQLAVNVPSNYEGDLLHRFKSAAGNYTTNTTFLPGVATISGGGLYILPETPDLSVLEVLVNPRECTYGFETATCYDYIKVRNDSAHPLDLGLYRFRSGYSNVSSTSTNTAYVDDILAPGEFRTLTHDQDGKRVSFTANDGTIWLEDLHGFESYDLGVSPYIDSDLTAQTGRSWAFNEETAQWQWATPSPDTEENDFTVFATPGRGEVAVGTEKDLVPCGPNQYRNPETNRCRNIATLSSLVPCREGQYRSEETNRCRSIATAAAAVLKPCADDQFRNPLTNRCKKIASDEDIALADCGEGRERNPETNRCRNVLGVSTDSATLPFPVEETPEGMERFAGWWVIGLLTAAGISYGVWEWRVELAAVGRKIGQFVAGKK